MNPRRNGWVLSYRERDVQAWTDRYRDARRRNFLEGPASPELAVPADSVRVPSTRPSF
jgi:hypothetical protein